MSKGQRDVLMGLVLLIVAGAGGAYLMYQKPVASASTTRSADKSYPPPLVPFDGQQAMKHIQAICDLGPRISGTHAHARMVDMVEKHFQDHGLTVKRQNFEAKQRSTLIPVKLTNLIASWKPERKVRLLICTHYDTRPLADQEEDSKNWRKPFLAANDGASGVAFMMEMARHLEALDAPLGIDFVCFDGEEYILDNRPSDQGGDQYFLGSRYFADDYAKRIKEGNSPWAYQEAILLDMIAGKNARFLMEGESMMKAPQMVERIWKIAEEQGARAFVTQRGLPVLDDHLELQRVGIPAIDIIPVLPDNAREGLLSYPHWHKLTDIPENCSADTLEQVAKVLAVWMKNTK